MYQQESKTSMQPNTLRLLLMGVASMLLCMSFLMSIFTPLPLAMSVLVYGRAKGHAMISGFWLLNVVLSFGVFKDITLFVFYSAACLFAVVISEAIIRKIHPVRAMVKSGLAFVAITALLTGGLLQTQDKSVKELLVAQIEKSGQVLEQQKEILKKRESDTAESFQLIAMLSQPDLLAQEILKEAPSYFFIGVFLMIWVNLFLCLRMVRILAPEVAIFTERDLINFKVPDQFVWLVIVGFILAIWGVDLGNTWYPAVGMTLLKCLGIFYFFQGFGIYLDFLDFIRLGGFIRTLLVMVTVLSVSQIIALVGLFDMFINFRRFFKKSN